MIFYYLLVLLSFSVINIILRWNLYYIKDKILSIILINIIKVNKIILVVILLLVKVNYLGKLNT